MSFEMEMAQRSLQADELVREGRAQLRQLVLDGHRRRLSQRRIAALTNRSQPEISRLLREAGESTRTWMTARNASEAIKEELQRGDEDYALRALITAISDFRDLSDPAGIQEFLRRPRPTGDRRWDTLLAAAVALACRRRGLSAPKWTRRAPLESWWFPAAGGALLAARTMARTPIDFSRLGIWLDASAFQTAMGKAPTSTTGLDRTKSVKLLTELGLRLSAKGVAGRLYVVGGAAMALEFDTRRTRRDIDSVLHPPTTVADVAASMATELGLPPGWLRAAAIRVIPLPDEDPVSLDVEGLQVAICSPANLLAMKMAARRPKDTTDLIVLFRHLKIRSPQQAVKIAERMYGDSSLMLSEPRESLLIFAESVLA